MESGDYINIVDNLERGKLSEGKSFSAVTKAALESQNNEAIHN